MFEVELLDKPEVRKLLAGSNVFSGYNVRLDIFTPFEPQELSAILDREYEEARRKADEVARDPEKIAEYGRARQFISGYMAPPLSPKDEFLQGPQGPPLGKGIAQGDQVWVHPLLQTISVRDYDEPQGDYAYSMVRRRLPPYQGHFWIFPKASQNVIPDDVHSLFNFVAKSDMCLPQFVFAMIELYGNYSPEALEAKMLYATPTTEEGTAQRDVLKKLAVFFNRTSVPFYATFHNPCNHHSELVYGINSDGKIVRQLTSASQTP
jgi:hypothetical protein